MISFGQISKIGVSTFLCSCGKEHFREKFAKKYQPLY